MGACPRYLCTCDVIVCMSARKKAPVNLLMCPFELYMFIGLSSNTKCFFLAHTVGRLPLEKKIHSPVELDWEISTWICQTFLVASS